MNNERIQAAERSRVALHALVRSVRDTNGTTGMEYNDFIQNVEKLCNFAEALQAELDGAELLRRVSASLAGSAWAGMWHSKNRVSGVSEHLLYENLLPKLFKTRRQAREWIEAKYGYIRSRDDLCREPHGWTVPRAIRVSITPNIAGELPREK